MRQELADIGRVPNLPRSALACWWSITALIRATQGPCYLWTFTAGSGVYPDHYFGNMHRALTCNVKNMAQRETQSSDGGTIPRNWGGVRVFEVHPEGHGLHAHWVMRGRMPWELMQRAAIKAGLGYIVHVDPKPVTVSAAYYLACYLTKGDKLEGCRQWANIGTWDGIGKRDLVLDSQRIRDVKAWRYYWVRKGKKPYHAYLMALRCVEDGMVIPGANPF